MPFLAAAVPMIAGALGASAATAATVGTVANVAAGAYSAYQGIKGASDAKKAAGQAGSAAQVDINALNDQIKEISRQNALDSAELEKQLTPEVPALRSAANQGILAGLRPDATQQNYTNMLSGSLGQHLQTPLLQAAIARAKADLGMGGKLDLDTRNEVTRHAAATAGTVAQGGLGLGRDVSARDLGLTSLQLQQQRLANATQLGGMEQQGAEFDAGNLLNKIQMLKAISDGNFGRNVAAAQYGESIRQPLVGIDPGSLANIAVGNNNARSAALASQANISGQSGQNWLKLAGQIGGTALTNYQKPTTPSPASYADYVASMSNGH